MKGRLDAIIFGATGYTGKFVVEHAVEIFKDLTWGIAGRNEAKLEAVLREVSAKVNRNLENIPIILADVNDERSIQAMSAKCKIMLNCCGPYRLYGEIVVKSCIEAGAHYVDVTGEPQFMAKMLLKYNEMAEAKGVYVVSACGFESIPAELGVVYVEKKFEGIVNSVEMFLETEIEQKDRNCKVVANIGSWKSLVYALGHPIELFMSQRKVNQMIAANVPRMSPKLCLKPYIQKPSFLNSYFLPFPATDYFLIKQSQRLRYRLEDKIPTQFESYIGFRSLLVAILISIFSLIYLLLAQCSCTRNLLIKYPKIFTMGYAANEGPTDSNTEGASFKMTFKAKGWSKEQKTSGRPDKKLLAQATGSNIYAVTGVCLLYCARIMLNESEGMPQRGGVLPPGAAFAKTSLLDQLPQHKYGVKFEILD